MRKIPLTLLTILLAAQLCGNKYCLAEDYKPAPFEKATAEDVTCSWSKMKSRDYQNCQKKKDYFNSMTQEEKEKYNKEVDSRKTDSRLKRLERSIPGIPVEN